MQGALIKRASEIQGGVNNLARRLGVTERQLRLWQRALEELPVPLFLRLVDIVLQDDIARASEDRRSAPRRDAVVRLLQN